MAVNKGKIKYWSKVVSASRAQPVPDNDKRKIDF